MIAGRRNPDKTAGDRRKVTYTRDYRLIRRRGYAAHTY